MKYSIIVPAQAEREMLPFTLDSLVAGVDETCGDGEIIIAVNASPDDTTEVAQAWIDRHQATSEHPLDGQVLETDIPGKKNAQNLGLTACKGELIICSDADVQHNPRTLPWTIDHMDNNLGTQLLGTLVLPNTNRGYLPKNKVLAHMIRMNRARLLSLPPARRVSGAYYAFRDTADIEFPDSFAGDDLWIAAHMIDEYGEDSVHFDSRYPALAIPPQTLKDYIKMHARFSVSHELLVEAHPELAEAREIMLKNYPQTAGNEINFDKWRSLCLRDGVPFDIMLPIYEMAQAAIRKQAPSVKADRIANGGRWERIDSTKHRPVTSS